MASNGKVDVDTPKGKSPLAIESIACRYWSTTPCSRDPRLIVRACWGPDERQLCRFAVLWAGRGAQRNLTHADVVGGVKTAEDHRDSIPRCYGNDTSQLLENFVPRCEN